jgi:hypothetical protein
MLMELHLYPPNSIYSLTYLHSRHRCVFSGIKYYTLDMTFGIGEERVAACNRINTLLLFHQEEKGRFARYRYDRSGEYAFNFSTLLCACYVASHPAGKLFQLDRMSHHHQYRCPRLSGRHWHAIAGIGKSIELCGIGAGCVTDPAVFFPKAIQVHTPSSLHCRTHYRK